MWYWSSLLSLEEIDIRKQASGQYNSHTADLAHHTTQDVSHSRQGLGKGEGDQSSCESRALTCRFLQF